MKHIEWRDKVEHLAKLSFEKDERILAILFYGSSAEPATMDRWSDVDLMYIVRDKAFAPFNADTFFEDGQLTVFSKAQELGSDFHSSRLCFDGFKRLDITTHPVEWLTRNKIPHRSIVIAHRLPDANLLCMMESDRHYMRVEDRPNFKETQEFLHKLQLAAAKVMRSDVLIGAHLTLDLYRDALVVLMKRRDNAEATNHHRYGSYGNAQAYELLNDLKLSSTKDILKSLRKIGIWYVRASEQSSSKESDSLNRLIDECLAQN